VRPTGPPGPASCARPGPPAGRTRPAGLTCPGCPTWSARPTAARKNAAPGATLPTLRPARAPALPAMSWHQGVYTKQCGLRLVTQRL
jgi:hypothetical protein